jgi:AdoMet-dependent rRNA methyltransferase SPB1
LWFFLSLYRKYGVIGQKKPNVKYVVSKKSQRGGRPAGTKGPYKVVDKRLKKDKRAAKNRSKKQSNNKGRRPQKSANRNKRT